MLEKEKKLNEKQINIFIVLGLFLIIAGLFLVFYNYYNLKKDKAYEEMGLAIFDYYSEAEVETEVLVDSNTNDTNNKNITDEESDKNSDEVEVEINDSFVPTNYYVGYLEIPKIDLRKGFTEIDSIHNNLKENIQVIEPSDYPDIDYGNFILAGHSGNTNISFFNDLYKLIVGDEVNIKYKDKEYNYVIIDIYEQPKTGVISIKRKHDITTLTLVTCTRGDNKTQTVYIAKQI